MIRDEAQPQMAARALWGASRAKAWGIYALCLLGVVILYAVFDFLPPDELYRKGAFIIGALLIGVPYIFSFPSVLIRSAVFSADTRGIKIPGFGFVPWEKCKVIEDGDGISLLVVGAEYKGAASRWNGMTGYLSARGGDMMVSASFPPFLSIGNLEALKRYCRQSCGTAQAEQITCFFSLAEHHADEFHVPSAWMKSGRAKRLMLMLSLLFVCLFVYFIFFMPAFYLSDLFLWAGGGVSTLLGWLFLYFVIRNRRRNPVLAGMHSWSRLPVYSFGAVLYPFMIFIAFFASPAAIHARYAGEIREIQLPYEKNENFFSYGSCGYRWRPDSQAGTRIKSLCLSSKIYATLPSHGVLKLRCYETALGCLIDGFAVTAPHMPDAQGVPD